MCVMSMIGDQFVPSIPDRHDWLKPYIPPAPTEPAWQLPPDLSKLATKDEVDALRKELAELKDLLRAAQKFDASTGQPNCEKPEKLRLLFALAAALGVDDQRARHA